METGPTNSTFYVYRVRFPEGFRDVASLLPLDLGFAFGLAAEVIVGAWTTLQEGDSITDAGFQANRHFVQLLHDVVATEAPTLPALQAEARRQYTGWVYLIDARTPTPGGEVPPSDIVGAFEVKEGVIVPQSYQPNANHRLLSSNGFFKLEPSLHQRLMERLVKQATASDHSTG